MFTVAYGSENRENEIRRIAQSDRTHALMLAAVHFEWMLKRTILKIGVSPTKELRERLDKVYKFTSDGGKNSYKMAWDHEVSARFKNSALGTVLGRLQKHQVGALRARGKVIHGNGTVSQTEADEAIAFFLDAGKRLREFTLRTGDDLDSRLKVRRIPRAVK